jgi:hypothetical protein
MQKTINALRLVIEGKEYEWSDQFITGKQLKQLADLPANSEIYLTLKDPWVDEHIKDETRVDLARPGIEQFRLKKHLKFTIDGEQFKWDNQFITGKELRQLAKLNSSDEIFLDVSGSYEDQLITNDTKVDLARPGVEHFFSKEREKQVTLIVNGTPKNWEKRKIKFQDVIILAYGTYVDKPTMVYTVAYEDGPKQNPEGSMVKGSQVFVKNKMIFHATATDKS